VYIFVIILLDPTVNKANQFFGFLSTSLIDQTAEPT